jgi:hypothetical protein
MRGGSNFEGYVVLTETDNFQTATQSFCQDVRAQYQLAMPVLYDETGAFASMMQARRHWHFVIKEGGEIDYRVQNSPGDRGFEAAVEALLP